MPLMPASASAFRFSWLRSETTARSASAELGHRLLPRHVEGQQALRLDPAAGHRSATIGEPQKGQRSATSLGGRVASAPHFPHLTVSTSSVSCSPATFASHAW